MRFNQLVSYFREDDINELLLKLTIKIRSYSMMLTSSDIGLLTKFYLLLYNKQNINRNIIDNVCNVSIRLKSYICNKKINVNIDPDASHTITDYVLNMKKLFKNNIVIILIIMTTTLLELHVL